MLNLNLMVRSVHDDDFFVEENNGQFYSPIFRRIPKDF